MDQSVQRLLNDKLYDKRKQGALELERLVRDAVANQDHEKIRKVVEQLCHEYAYAVHQPHARNGGLIGLAAASIALGSEEVARYLKEIVPPVLACFSDQDARVRYYACESMYNIAKVAKGEILLFFNAIFDALCKLAADSELSVKNGAELLDRLIKDIVSESAASYVSVLETPEDLAIDADSMDESKQSAELPTAFSLAKFIPLLQERITVSNPFTRTFLVSWITLLDTIPDLELVYYLPSFLGGLFKFLGDPNRDVHVATQGVLERFLSEIKKIARLKRGLSEGRKAANSVNNNKSSSVSDNASEFTEKSTLEGDVAIADTDSGTAHDTGETVDGDWLPGQDVQVDHAKIIDILITFLDIPPQAPTTPSAEREKEEEIQVTALRWVDSFFEISPEDILQFVPRLLSQVLPAMSSNVDQVRQAANRVNTSLMEYIMSLSEDVSPTEQRQAPSRGPTSIVKESESKDRRSSTPSLKPDADSEAKKLENSPLDATPRSSTAPTPQPTSDLDYAAAVSALTLQFLNEHEATRVAALAWLIMLHRKAPRKVVAFNDGTFPALLKTLSDPAEAVVTRDLQLLSQISKNSEDGYFTSFMVNLLQLFATDRKLLEVRGNLIIRQLCMNLSAERIYRTLADCLEKDEDVEFASIMVQILNNNLITAPELQDLRKRLRNLETREGQTFFVALFRSWCHNAVATFSLCLLAQAYEQAYNLLQLFADLEMTVSMLIQIDKLVQLLESPVFTYLRLQLLEPEKYPYLYKCLYGLLMLLPQSSAFAALKNRLNSVSAIGLIHTPTPLSASSRSYVYSSSSPSTPAASMHVSSPISYANIPPSLQHRRQRSTEAYLPALAFSSTPGATSVGGVTGSYDRPNRLKSREDSGTIRWVEMVEKFKSVQDKARRSQRPGGDFGDSSLSNGIAGFSSQEVHGVGAAAGGMNPPFDPTTAREKNLPDLPRGGGGAAASGPGGSGSMGGGGGGSGAGGAGPGQAGSRRPSPDGSTGPMKPLPSQAQGHKSKSSLGNLGRLAGGIGQRKSKK